MKVYPKLSTNAAWTRAASHKMLYRRWCCISVFDSRPVHFALISYASIVSRCLLLCVLNAIGCFVITGVKEQRICVKFYLKLRKTVFKSRKQLKCAVCTLKASSSLPSGKPGHSTSDASERSHVTILFDCEGIVHTEFIPPGQKVNHHS